MAFGIPVHACASCGLRDLTKTYHREAVGELSEEFKLSAVQVQGGDGIATARRAAHAATAAIVLHEMQTSSNRKWHRLLVGI